ncbi:NAD-dependent epimerase/dehydratase family protein [Sphingobacterium sp.]|uniref:NAD-dependent epimerase/dehydratase family protein n=1 Tax=Sphingobacterium sp. TaxID=341027 RepID=UPI0028A8DD88|nr:NAD-dependent epimerase/dehydratase family protein [Sphingobacterium sp.]
MEITITGATGFVGTNLTKYLEAFGYSVNLLSLRNTGWIEGLNLNCDAVIHLAGKAHDTSNSSNPEEYFKINRDLTILLFNKFLNSNIKDFFYFSSVKAVADSVDKILTETNKASPLTPYGQSKLEAENFLLKQNLPSNKRLFIIRPCMIHGLGNKGNLNLLYNIVKKGIPWPLGAFENKRSFLSVDNLNYLIQNMLSSQSVRTGIYNFADDGQMSTNELFKLISDVLGKKAKIWTINKNLIINVAKIGEKISLPLNTERLKKLTESYLVSNQKIKTELGILQLPTSIDQGLRKTIESFKINPN